MIAKVGLLLCVLGGALAADSKPHAHDEFHNQWFTAKSMPVALIEVSTVASEGYLYAFGVSPSRPSASAATYRYSPKDDEWEVFGDNRPFVGGFSDPVVVKDDKGKDKYIYLVGGLSQDEEESICERVQRLDLTSGKWKAMSDANSCTYQGQVTYHDIDGKPSIVVCGGASPPHKGEDDLEATGHVHGHCQILDVKSDKWGEFETHPPTAVSGAAHCEEPTTDSWYILGGAIEGGDYTDEVQVYSWKTKEWTTSTEPLPLARGSLGAAICGGGEVYVAGGVSEDGAENRVDILTIKSEEWRRGPKMRVSRASHASLLYGMMFFPGGVGLDGRALRSMSVLAVEKMDLDGENHEIHMELMEKHPVNNEADEAVARGGTEGEVGSKGNVLGEKDEHAGHDHSGHDHSAHADEEEDHSGHDHSENGHSDEKSEMESKDKSIPKDSLSLDSVAKDSDEPEGDDNGAGMKDMLSAATYVLGAVALYAIVN